jgi:hypothetical protein
MRRKLNFEDVRKQNKEEIDFIKSEDDIFNSL